MFVSPGQFLLVIVLVGLAMPPGLRDKSWKRFFIALALSTVGIVLPLLVFLASAIFVPSTKAGQAHA